MTITNVFSRDQKKTELIHNAISTLYDEYSSSLWVINNYKGYVYQSVVRVFESQNVAVLRTLVGTISRLNTTQLIQVSNLAEKLANESEMKAVLPDPFVLPRS